MPNMLLVNKPATFALLGLFLRSGYAQSLPAQAVMVNPATIGVMSPTASYRGNTFAPSLNPTSTKAPFFQVYNSAFLDILGSNASIRAVATDPTFAFAHEAPIWNPNTDDLFFCSNDGGYLGRSNINTNSQVSKISLKDVANAISASHSTTSAVNVSVTFLSIPDTVQMTNGGTGPFQGDLLLVTSGRGTLPPSVVRVNPASPYNTTVLLDNYFGVQFNSLNDVKVHPTSGAIFFTDSSYGYINKFRSQPNLPNQVYRLDPVTRQVRVIADGFIITNGIAFTGDGKTAYVSDTAAAGASTGPTQPATIYQFDVDSNSQAFGNRRVFAYSDAGIPDGIQVDKQGNVYAGCADGVHVWNSKGDLLGKIYLGTTSANMAFASNGRILIMAETTLYLAQTQAQGLDFASFGS